MNITSSVIDKVKQQFIVASVKILYRKGDQLHSFPASHCYSWTPLE